ncbi:nitrous oxide reductase family maturation protein NosD [Sulfurimonas lithotrophica]|uniref:Nitrous oxide reductase family maturation protein NosD n=1 Tax=Sulfurimonas lithotrophica TaxID=2590022 RepID=A0A5P8NZ45_9BACT|nr:nitrous oxide reductase family maturation protein NosD [Sulfurimonas lithotrophica]QFR48723.1 nitrous oxide reductase family maturation protein NosD [Sulfurimonas lithotrophica]
MKSFLFYIFFITGLLANPLQEAIDNASAYSTIKLSPQNYRGNIIINKPLTIISTENEKATIQGSGFGNVININSSDVTLKNLNIYGSGDKMYKLDSAIYISKSSNVKIDGCNIKDSLYGIHMEMVEKSVFSNNYISSKNLPISLRGDALKIYYSHNNLFKNNTIEKSRDITLDYSHNNIFQNNIFRNNRFASHIALSRNNLFKDNIYKHNSVSIMLMGAHDTNVTGNTIKSSDGAAGIGVMIGGVSNFRFERNTLKFNAKAIYIESKEKAKGMKRYISYNDISYNGEAIHFHVAIKDNTITHNKIYGNIDDIVKDIDGHFSKTNVVEYNYWDNYQSFDANKDNIGDKPHQVYQYADQLWHHNHKIKFFYASPIMSLMNFLLKLAPFIEPNLLMEDKKPIVEIDK